MTPLRIGLVGAGMIGEAHSAILQQIALTRPGEIDLVAVCDVDPQRRTHIADRYGYRQSFTEEEKLIAEAEIDALFVCTPTRFHADAVRAAAARGLHLFCEKPAAMTAAEGDEMLAAVQSAGVQCQIGLVLRFSPVYNVVRQLLQSPEADGPVAVVFRDDQCFPIRGLHHTPWRKDATLSAGGTLIEHGVHDLDLLTWYFGRPTRVRGWTQHRFGFAGIEDYAAAEIEFANGVRAQLVNVWHDMLQRPSNRRLEIFCSRAFVASEHDMMGDVLFQTGDGPLVTIAAHDVLARFQAALPSVDPAYGGWYAIPYFVQDLAFVEAIRAGRSVFPDLALGLKAQRLAESIYESARRGVEIELGDGI